MANIDVAIADADRHLARLDLHAAFDSYLNAVSLIVKYFAKETVFVSTPPSEGSEGERRFKNEVKTVPEDAQRLFDLAHLCFTEAEDIMFGTVSVDDLEPYEEQDDDTLIHQADAVKQKDFREHRLSRPRSIRSAHSSLNRSSTWSSYRSSLARKLDPTSVESSVDKLTKSTNIASPNASAKWILDANRANSPPPHSDASSTKGGEESQPAPSDAPESRESLIWHFPSVPRHSQPPNPLRESRDGSSSSWYIPPPSPAHQLPDHEQDPPRPTPASPTPQQSMHQAPMHDAPASEPPSPQPAPPALLSQMQSFASVSSQPLQSGPYLPLIPASPLIHQHRVLSEQYHAACAQLEMLENTQHKGARPYSQTAGTLSQIRRLVETSGLAKRKLAQLSTLITEWDRPRLVDMDPEELGKAILCFDVDMFRGIRALDIVAYSTSSGTQVPDPLKRALDFSLFLQRTVQSTIVEHDQALTRASSIIRWISVAQALFIHRDLQGVYCVISALSSAPITRLDATWKLINKKYRAVYEDLRSMVSDADGWRWYKQQLDKVEKPCVPISEVMIRTETGEARRVMDICRQEEFRWDKEVGTVGNPVVAVGAMHWLVTRCWMTDLQVEGLSTMWEPATDNGSIAEGKKSKPFPFISAPSNASMVSKSEVDETLLRRFNRLGKK